MKQGYFVVGPESSGTRLMTQLLMGVGCFGDYTHDQRLDEPGLWPDEQRLVWRRSVPHRHNMPDVFLCIMRMRSNGYNTTVLVMSRDWHSMAISQEQIGHVKSTTEALSNIQLAYTYIFNSLLDATVAFEIVNYEALVARPQECAHYLFNRIGLGSSKQPKLPVVVYDGNARYYERS